MYQNWFLVCHCDTNMGQPWTFTDKYYTQKRQDPHKSHLSLMDNRRMSVSKARTFIRFGLHFLPIGLGRREVIQSVNIQFQDHMSGLMVERLTPNHPHLTELIDHGGVRSSSHRNLSRGVISGQHAPIAVTNSLWARFARPTTEAIASLLSFVTHAMRHIVQWGAIIRTRRNRTGRPFEVLVTSTLARAFITRAVAWTGLVMTFTRTGVHTEGDVEARHVVGYVWIEME